MSLAGYVWGIVVNNSSIMALSLVPLAAIYAILFLMTILSDEIVRKNIIYFGNFKIFPKQKIQFFIEFRITLSTFASRL